MCGVTRLLFLLSSHFYCYSLGKRSDCAGVFTVSQKPGREHSLHRLGHKTTGSQPAGDTQVCKRHCSLNVLVY